MSLRRIQTVAYCITLVYIIICAHPAIAHDSWLIVDQNTAAEGDSLWLSFVTGEVFPLGEKATDPKRVADLVDRHGGRTEQVTGYAPREGGLSVRRPVTGPGIHVIGCALNPHLIEMKLDGFEKYLRSERADAAMARLADSKPSPDKTVVEAYTKFAKTIVEVLPCPTDDESWKAPLGHRLEIVPMSNPCHWKTGQTVRVQVLLDGHPWEGVPISVGHEGADAKSAATSEKKPDDDSHAYTYRTVTDAKGVASIPLDRAGHGFVKAHLIRPTEGLSKAKWESFWATLTFRVTGKTDVGGELRSIRGVHGRLSPGAVIGYRMGLAALRQLDLPHGDDALLVRHACPLETHYTAMVDGIQAATGASLGRLSLWIDPADSPARMQTLFINQRTGETLRLNCRDDWRDSIAQTHDPFDVEALALKAATLADDLLFELTSSSPAPAPESAPDILTRR